MLQGGGSSWVDFPRGEGGEGEGRSEIIPSEWSRDMAEAEEMDDLDSREMNGRAFSPLVYWLPWMDLYFFYSKMEPTLPS